MLDLADCKRLQFLAHHYLQYEDKKINDSTAL